MRKIKLLLFTLFTFFYQSITLGQSINMVVPLGHNGYVDNLGYSSDGKLLVTTSEKEIILWDRKLAKEIKRIDTLVQYKKSGKIHVREKEHKIYFGDYVWDYQYDTLFENSYSLIRFYGDYEIRNYPNNNSFSIFKDNNLLREVDLTSIAKDRSNIIYRFGQNQLFVYGKKYESDRGNIRSELLIFYLNNLDNEPLKIKNWDQLIGRNSSWDSFADIFIGDNHVSCKLDTVRIKNLKSNKISTINISVYPIDFIDDDHFIGYNLDGEIFRINTSNGTYEIINKLTDCTIECGRYISYDKKQNKIFHYSSSYRQITEYDLNNGNVVNIYKGSANKISLLENTEDNLPIAVTTFNRGLKATSTQTDRWKENSFLIDYKAQDKFSIVEKKKSHSIYGNIDYAVIPLNANDSVILKKRVPFSPAFFIDLPSNRPVLDEESIVVDETNKLIIESFGDTINVFNFRSELLYSKVGLDVSYFFVRNNHTWGFDDGSDFGNDFAGWDYIDPEEPQYDTISNPFEFYYYKELVVSDNVLLGMAYLGRFEAIFPILYRIDKKSKKLEYLESKINHFNKIEVDYDFLGVVDEKYGLSIVNDSSLIFWDIATQNIRWEIPILEGISYDNQLPIILEEKGIAVYHHKDVVKFYDLENKKALINLIITSDGEWIAWNENGQFDGTRAIEEIVFEKDLTLIEVTQLKDRFYEPNLLQKVLGKSKEPLRKSRGLNNIDLYPKIKLGHPDQNRGKLNIGLYNQGGGYGAVTIAINGKEVISDVRNSDFSYNADSVTLTYDIKNHPFLKVGEVNTIEVSAYNSEEYLVSRPQKLYYIPKGKKDDYEPTLHAIIVGTANYSGNDLDLKYPAKDALSFASALKLSSDNLLGIDKTNIQVLTTDSQDQLYPTKENIKNTYQKIAKEAKPYDALVLYFAGHGVNYGGVEGDFYYITSDAYNANLKDPVVRENVSISSNELTEWIKDIPALKQVLIFDACHSGQFAEDLLAKRDLRSASEIRSLERMKDRTGMYILSGSAADAVSYEASVYGQGLLTYALLFGMKGASLRDGKFVDVVQLFQFAANKVPELAENIGGVQKPEIRVPYGGESFDIGLLESKDKDKIKLPSPKPLFIRSGFQNQITFADDLELSDLINQKLKDLQASEDNRIIFVDASKFSNAYSIRGLYIEEKDRINLKANLIKDGSIVGSFSDNASSKDKLIIDIFSWLEESLSSRQN